MDELFSDMQSKGLVSTSSSWLETAIQQHAKNLTIQLCQTQLEVYDKFFPIIVTHETLN